MFMNMNRLALAAVAAYASAPAAAESIYDLIAGNPEFSTLNAAIDAAGLDETLSDGGPFTIFGPVNSAFAALPAELIEKLLMPLWQPQLQDVLLFHGVMGELPLDDITDGQTEEALNEELLTFSVSAGVPTPQYQINGNANINAVEENEADNGILHPIDAVLVPISVTNTVVDIASSRDEFSTLVAALQAADLVDALSGEGPFTILAPTNAAFAKFPDGFVESLLQPENKDDLVKLLLGHVVAANAPSSSLASGEVETLNGETVLVDVSDDGIKVGGANGLLGDANVISPDIIANNGILHAIDNVLLLGDMPDRSIYEWIVNNPEVFSTLNAAIDAAGLAETLSDDGPFTIFGPVNPAFEKLPPGLIEKLLDPLWQPQLIDLLMFHGVGRILPLDDITDGQTEEALNGGLLTFSVTGGQYEINGNAKVLSSALGSVEQEASNGILNAIDAVLVSDSVSKTIVDIAATNPDFSILVEALGAADLADALSGEGPFTVLAPNNAAFRRLPSGTLERLLDPVNIDELVALLLRHVVSANALSSSLSSGDVETLNGDTVYVDVSGDGIKVDDANVIAADIIASNGIIHALDAVLIPPTDTDPPTKAPTVKSAKSTKSSKSSKSSKGSKKAPPKMHKSKSSKGLKVNKRPWASKGSKRAKRPDKNVVGTKPHPPIGTDATAKVPYEMDKPRPKSGKSSKPSKSSKSSKGRKSSKNKRGYRNPFH